MAGNLLLQLAIKIELEAKCEKLASSGIRNHVRRLGLGSNLVHR
jgi:hypothetical protein